MKKIVILSVIVQFLSGAFTAFSAPVTEEQVHKAATTFLAVRYPAGSQRTGQPFTISTIEPLLDDAATIGYLVHLSPAGYVLMRADDLCPPIKLYTESGDFSTLPPDFSRVITQELGRELDILNDVQGQRQALTTNFKEEWTFLLNPPADLGPDDDAPVGPRSGGPLLSTTWNQLAPYNYYAPTCGGQKAPTGCAATALAQLLRYHQWPQAIASDYTYTDSSGSCTGTYSMSDAGVGEYDWASMPTAVYTSSSLAQQQAVGQLMYHSGVAVNMDFEADGSGASMYSVKNALQTYFSYSAGSIVYRQSYSNTEWYNTLDTEITNNRPVYYAFFDNSSGAGHGVLCDGTRNGNEMHLNMGWGGYENAWYNMDNIQAAGYTFNDNHQAIWGIKTVSAPVEPPAYVVASDGEFSTYVSVSWPAVAGASYYQVYRNSSNTAIGAAAVSGWQTTLSFFDTTATPGTTYYYWVKAATDSSGTSASAYSPYDTGWRTLPAPASLFASDGSYTGYVFLSWGSVSGATYYQVYRNSNNSTTGAAAISSWQVSRYFSDTTAAPGVTYYYWVKAATDSSGANASAYSSSNDGWRALSVPASVSASDGSDAGYVYVDWGSVSGASYYQVYRNTSDSTSDASAVSSWQTALSFSDTTATPGVTYYYWVKAATSSSGTRASAYSSSNDGWRALSPPSSVSATDGTLTENVRISWNSASGANYYRVYRNTTGSTSSATAISGWQTGQTYDDATAVPGDTYYYAVRAAADSAGTRYSGFSAFDEGSAAAAPAIYTSYLAEGYTGGTFKTYISLLNPSAQAQAVDVTFLKEDGTTTAYPITMPGLSRRVLDAGAIVPSQGFSTTVESTVQIPAERAMYWDAGGQAAADGHSAPGMSELSAIWYLAEGYNSTNSANFKTYILLVNPNDTAANVAVTFMKEDGTTVPYSRTVAAKSRSTIMTEALIPAGGFATKLESNVPILVERAMYWAAGGVNQAGGHNTIGVSTLSKAWFFAEGYNNGNFQTYLMLMNPNSTAVTVSVTFMKEDGTNVPYTRTIPANSRSTILTEAVIPNAGFSTTVQADAPIVAERAMYWGAGGVPRAGGHDTVGVANLATDWYFAEGYTGGTYQTYLMLLNPNSISAEVAVKFMKDDGTIVPYSRTVTAHSRSTILTKSIIPDGGFATHISANIPIMAERAMYWASGGVAQAGGHCSTGIPYQSTPNGARTGTESTYLLTVITAGSGSGSVTGTGIDCGADCTERYAEGTILNLKATPETGSSFAGWLINGEKLTGTVPVDRDMIVTAIFE